MGLLPGVVCVEKQEKIRDCLYFLLIQGVLPIIAQTGSGGIGGKKDV
jgi:hypothetical protein